MRRLTPVLFALLGCTDTPVTSATDVANDIPWIIEFDFGPPPEISGPTPLDAPSTEPDGEATDAEPEDSVEDTGCVPSCGTAEAPFACGPDGCGGECGTCEAGFACVVGACAPLGGTCDAPGVLVAGAETNSLLVTAVLDQSQCALPADGTPVGAGAPDIALEVRTPDAPALLEVVTVGAGLLTRTSVCGTAGTCLDGPSDRLVLPVGTWSVSFEAASAEITSATLSLTRCDETCAPSSCLENACGIPCACPAGTFCRADGLCGPAKAGDACFSASPQGALANTTGIAVTLDGYGRDHSCTPEGSVDTIYTLSPLTDRRVRVTVESSNANVGARLVTACDVASSCSASGRATPGAPRGSVLAAGRTAWLVVDGPTEASVNVSVEPCDTCDATCPCFAGQDCVAGFCVVPTATKGCDSPLTVTLDQPASYTLAGTSDAQRCFDGDSGTDAVTRFVAPHAGEFGLRFDSLHALRAFELTRCGDPSSCAASMTTPIDVVRTLEAGEATTWVLDRSVPAIDSGFTVTATDCAAACVGAPCDRRVCGRTCGCGAGEACVDSACVAAEPADSCASPPTLTSAPSTLTLDLGPLRNDFSCRGRGTTSPDAAIRFVAPGTGTYSAKAGGLGSPIVYRPTGCGTGISSCEGREDAPVLSQEFFFAREGESVWLVLDRLAPESLSDTAVTLTVTRVTGLQGGLGGACASSQDCTLSERCLYGVCTQRCASNAECGAGASGPRGTQFGCPTDICVPGPDGCISYCTAGAGGALGCNDDATCGGADRCTGFALSDGQLTPFCSAGGSLAPRGAPCASSSACASNLCVSGLCREPCKADGACTPAERCLGVVGDTVPGGPRAVVGACIGAKDLGAACTVDADCPGASCDAVLAPDGSTRFVCRTPPTGAQFTFGELCAKDSQCTTGRCLFGDVLGLLDAHCTSGCSSDADCTLGTTCRPHTLWDGDTPSDPADDVALPVCQRGNSGAGCLSAGVNTCDSGLLCKPTTLKPAYGKCAAP